MKPLNLLIVEDDLDHGESLAELLELEGHTVTVVESGEAAVALCREASFDLTFMDMKLPGINGLEAFRQIRLESPEAVMVVMTRYRVEQLVAEAMENGALRVLSKPIAIEDVLGILREVQPAGMVLVADDDPDFADSVAKLLTEHGYKVLVAENGREAVDKVVAQPFDVLVLDLRLPVLDGLSVYLELKKRGRAVSTIIVTGYPREESEAIDVLRSMSVMGILYKPFEPAQLLQALDDLRGAADG